MSELSISDSQTMSELLILPKFTEFLAIAHFIETTSTRKFSWDTLFNQSTKL